METFADRVKRVLNVDLESTLEKKFTTTHEDITYKVNVDKEEIEILPELTFGQKAVGLTFNHGTGEIFEQVDRAKKLSADLIDLLEHSLKTKEVKLQKDERLSWSTNVFRTAAFNAIIAAQMAIVKFITWKN
jgi:hypothetical protein